jgi:hypothetical protein
MTLLFDLPSYMGTVLLITKPTGLIGAEALEISCVHKWYAGQTYTAAHVWCVTWLKEMSMIHDMRLF